MSPPTRRRPWLRSVGPSLEGVPLLRHCQVLDEPVPGRGAGLLEELRVGLEVATVVGEQFLGLRSRIVNLALNVGEVQMSRSAMIISSDLGVTYGRQPAGSNSKKCSNERMVVSFNQIPEVMASRYSSGIGPGNAQSSLESTENIGAVIAGSPAWRA